MRGTLCCCRFDYYQLLAYRKSMLFFLLYPALMAFFTGEAMSGVTFVGIMSTMTVGYAFSIEERYRTDRLALPVDRKAKVRGRYLFTVGLIVAISLLGPVEGILLSVLMDQPLDLAAALGLWLATVLAVLILASFQLPVFFKVGYMKGRYVAVIPFMLCCLSVPLLLELLRDEGTRAVLEKTVHQILGNPLFLLAALGVGAILALGISYRLSTRMYSRREL